MKQFLNQRSTGAINRWVAFGVVLIITGWHLVASANKWHLQKIATELVSTREFFGTPIPNHAGTKLFYAETTENGVAGYTVDISSGVRKLLFEHEQSHLKGVGLLGWSPDDSLFAYSVRSPDGEIFVCDGNSDATLSSISESKIVLDGVWLSNETLVYVNNNQDLTVLQKLNTEWHKSALFAKIKPPQSEPEPFDDLGKAKPAKKSRPKTRASPGEPLQHLTVVSENSVAWQKGPAIWMCELGSAPIKIWESTTNTLLNFCYLGDRQVFKLFCKDAEGESICTLYPAYAWHDERITDFEPISPLDGVSTSSLTFIHNGSGYVRLARSETSDAIIIKAGSNSVPIQFTWAGGVDSLTVNSAHVYVVGSPTNGPLGIWDYEINAGSMSSVVSGSELPFKSAKIVTAVHETATNAAGESIVYHLSPPVDLKEGKKYPLVIGFTGHRWRPQEAAVANAGCFFASCNGIPFANDGDDVTAVYRAAIQNRGMALSEEGSRTVSSVATFYNQGPLETAAHQVGCRSDLSVPSLGCDCVLSFPGSRGWRTIENAGATFHNCGIGPSSEFWSETV